jgi:hypothetical protein
MQKYIKTLFLILSLYFVETAYGYVIRTIKVGKMYHDIVDSGDQGEGTRAYGDYYYNHFQSGISSRGTHIGTKDWYDENDNFVPFKICGSGTGSVDEDYNTIPWEDDEGLTIRRYFSNEPPTITVNGYELQEPFPLLGDEINPTHIPGTADAMIESWVILSMGLTMRQRVIAWSQANHDDYVIWDLTFKNTGNVDLDDDIELPNQTLKDVYFFRCTTRGGWLSKYGERPGDTLRIVYGYDSWSEGATYDDFGGPNFKTSFLDDADWEGEAILHCDSSVNNHSDDITQPRMTGGEDFEVSWIKQEHNVLSEEEHALLYRAMEEGFNWWNGVPEMGDAYPGTHHSLRMDEQGAKYPRNLLWWTYSPRNHYACGPFTMAPGDSFRVVYASVMGTITNETSHNVCSAWLEDTCTWDGPNNLPPPVDSFPELVPTPNDYAKDCWICTGKDSLFKNAMNALWAVQHNYDVPIPPPPPSITVTSLPEKILIEWGNESESVSDFAGYRVYKGIGHPDTTFFPIFECGEGTANSLTHSYEDVTAQRGIANFYFVTAFDDGVENAPGVNGVKEVLESSKYANRTTKPAYLTKAPSEDLSKIRVVPNPYSINAKELQYPAELDKIMFLNLPPVCTIRIYNESCDLMKTIEHTDGSGDEAWAALTGSNFMTTETGQIVVSGLYIANIETPEGESANVKFLIVR